MFFIYTGFICYCIEREISIERTIHDVLCDLIQNVQFKKREKTPIEESYF